MSYPGTRNYPEFIVKDYEFEKICAQFCGFHKVFLDALRQYKSIITQISTSAISSGATHAALCLYINYITALENVVEGLSDKCRIIVGNFIHALEDADDYLYDAGISNDARDFSQSCYEFLLSTLEKFRFSITDSFADTLYGGGLKILDFFGADGAKEFLHSCRRLLFDYHDETAAGLTALFDDAHKVDRTYGYTIPSVGPDYYTCQFDYIDHTLFRVQDMLEVMTEILNPRGGSFTVGHIEEKLGNAFQELHKYYGEVVRIASSYVVVTIEEISDFASQPWARSYFNGFVSPVGHYIAGIGTLETLQMLIFEMFGITGDKLIHGGDGKLTADEILAILRNDYGQLLCDRLFGDSHEYDVYLVKQHLLQVLQESISVYQYSGSDQEQIVDDFKTVFKYMEKYGEDWYKKLNTPDKNGIRILDGRTRTAKEYKAFLDSLDGAQKILKYGESGIEYLARLFADYSAGIDIIDSFERNFETNETVLDAVDQIRKLYNKEFHAWATEALGVLNEHGMDYAISQVSNVCPVIAVVNTIGETIDIAGEMTGLGTTAHNMYDSLTFNEIYLTSGEAYDNALQHFRKQTPGTAEYDQAAEDLSNCYNLHKHSIVQMYKYMAGASSGNYKSYYEYCAKQASFLSMKDGFTPSLLSYDDFCACRPAI